MKTNYYAILGLATSASYEQIRRRFHELARTSHPDLFSAAEKAEAEVRFQAITEAFNVLSDPARRRAHDQELLPTPGSARSQDPENEARALVGLGVRAFRAGRFTEAYDALNRATAIHPADARAWQVLAAVCRKLPERRSQAMAAIQKACDLEPMNADYLKAAGDIFAANGLSRRAQKFYNLAIKWGGRNTEVELALAKLEKSRLGHRGPSPS